MKSWTMILMMTALIAVTARAQEDEIPKGERLQGKVGPQLSSRADPELMPRTLKLDRLNLSAEVSEAFLAKLSEPKDPGDLELMREIRIDRMKRKLGTSRGEAELIREDFGIELPAERQAQPKAAEPEDTSIRDLLGIFLGLASIFGYILWSLRRA